mgnify:CR=1 FL=1
MDLFLIAKAQGADDYVSPTIPFIPPTGTVAPTVTNVVVGPSISLESNVLSLKKGERAKIKVVVYTDNREVRSFTIALSYDATLFKVIDANGEDEGVQVPYVNSFFIEEENTVTVSSNNVGKIRLKASATGSSPITNRVITEFEVEGLAMGKGEFEVLKNESRLLDTGGSNILSVMTGLSMSVGNETVTITPTITSTIDITQTVSPGGSGSPSPSKIITPKTALTDDLGVAGSLLLGTFLVIAGFYLYKKKRNYDLQ